MTATETIPEPEFDRLIKAHKITGDKTIEALRLVMVWGVGGADAARRSEIHQSAVTRGLARMRRPLCSSCGQELPESE